MIPIPRRKDKHMHPRTLTAGLLHALLATLVLAVVAALAVHVVGMLDGAELFQP